MPAADTWAWLLNGVLIAVEFDLQDLRYYCETCPYIYNIDRQISRSCDLKRKEVDDVLGGAEAWKSAPKTDYPCDKCPCREASFFEVQIRSADEPSTVFYKCVQCGHQSREG